MSVSTLEDERPPRALWEWALGVFVVACCSVWIAYRIHVIDVRFDGLIPRIGSLVFRDTTTNGGDMGAHVYWPWFLEHNWFMKGRLAGWSPSWYSGFPIGQYYFPFPAVLTAIFDMVLPYNVAFKLVTVLGPVSLPIGAYLLADQLDFPWPAAPLTSVATLYYQFELRQLNGSNSWTIYGGNLASGLAGEYSFTLSLSLGLFFLAALVFTLKTGKRAWVPALLLACCVTSHIVVAMAVSFLALVIWLCYRPQRTWRLAIPIGVVGALLTMVWTIPLVATEPYTSSMRYEKVTTYAEWIFGPGKHFEVFGVLPLPNPMWLWGLVLAAIIGGGFWLRRATLVMVIWTASFAVAFCVWPQDLAVWNTRFIPFYFLGLAFLAALGATEIARGVAYGLRAVVSWNIEGFRRDQLSQWRAEQQAVLAEVVAADAIAEGDIDVREAELVSDPYAIPRRSNADVELPEHLRRVVGRELRRRRSLTMSSVLAFSLVAIAIWAGAAGDEQGRGVVSYWSKWNYSGYEAKPAWTEYSDLMARMGQLGKTNGCGRAMWEPSAGDPDALNNYGTSLALELLPYFTEDCIGSMEGLYFESSPTKDVHFLTVSELAQHPSNPVRGLKYGNTGDFEQGVVHARMLGVRYLMFWTPESQRLARESDGLTSVLKLGDYDNADPRGWEIFEIKQWSLVEGLSVEPVVAKLRAGTKSTCWPDEDKPGKGQLDTNLNAWECVTGPWWMNPAVLGQPFTSEGPANWQHIKAARADDLSKVQRRAIDPAKVTNIREEVDSTSFDVDQINKPVVVRTSYFPNWEVSGARGPWRISPNLMVVIPTERHVTLSYGLTTYDWLGRIGTLLGLLLLGLMAWKFRKVPASWTSTGRSRSVSQPTPLAAGPLIASPSADHLDGYLGGHADPKPEPPLPTDPVSKPTPPGIPLD